MLNLVKKIKWLGDISGLRVTVHLGSCDRYSKFNDYLELLKQTRGISGVVVDSVGV
jgi:hypothetical protein